MKNRKNNAAEKVVMLILCVLLCAVAFCGCSNAQQNDAAVSDTSLETEQQSEEISEEITEESEEVKEEFVLSVGEWNGNKYTNESVGITLELPDDWKFYDYAELAEMNMISNAESMTVEEYEKALNEEFSSGGYLYIAETVSHTNHDRININVCDETSWYISVYDDKNECYDFYVAETAEEYANYLRSQAEEHYKFNNESCQLSDVASMDLCGITFYYYDDIKPLNSDCYSRIACALCDDYAIQINITNWHYWEGCMEEYCSYFK